MNDTIFALSSPAGGAIAVIRISGNEALETLTSVFSGDVKPRTVSHGKLLDGGETVDDIMAVYIPSPKTYTGEDMAELYTHGGAAVVSRALDLLQSKGLRPAEPGEFTRRAYINGKMDLAQAEAVMDVISASAERSAKAAVMQLEGSLSRELSRIEDILVDALSGIDAAIDYPDELEEDVFSGLPAALNEAALGISKLLEGAKHAAVLREGASIVILGRPNTGKSSLMNALIGHSRAIVTPVPGTTRDIIEEQTSFNGVPVRIADTAGLRETDDLVENIGIQRAKEAKENADLLLLAFDSAGEWSTEDESLLNETRGKERIAVLCKSDLEPKISENELRVLTGLEVCTVSSLTGEGIEELKGNILKKVAPSEESPLVTNKRHIALLKTAHESLESALLTNEPDCAATDIKTALDHIGQITGKTVDEKVLDRIFERFCVGK
ncbi:MAG: tRNA modification GTPase MnmE [Firmicutes bacterium ADurb.Bin182]|nr:MAG: tRNA modification GTPase MnmE [Firmicutes bacterium ADurb.Bin182]